MSPQVKEGGKYKVSHTAALSCSATDLSAREKQGFPPKGTPHQGGVIPL